MSEKMGSSCDDAPLVSLDLIHEVWLPFYREWKTDYIDAIPDKILQMDDPGYYKYKCRTNWFNGLKNSLHFFLPYIDDQGLTEKIRNYIYHLDFNVNWSMRRTAADIAAANDIIDLVLGYFDGKK